MKEKVQPTINEVTSLSRAAYNFLNVYHSGDGRWTQLATRVFPVVGEEPDHNFAADISELHDVLANLIRIADAELEVLDSVLEHYDDYMNAQKQ